VHRVFFCSLNAPRRFISESEGHPFKPPALWLCPMRAGIPFRTRGICEQVLSEHGYAKYLDWLQSPPHNFNRISSDILDQQSVSRGSQDVRTCVVRSDAQEVNTSCDMRMYIDSTHSCAVLKISPHLSRPSYKKLCNSIDKLLGLTYHVRFPPDYPKNAPVVRMIIPSVNTGHALKLGFEHILLDTAIWHDQKSFQDAFRLPFCSAISRWLQ